MENASKALIISGAVLLAIMIVTLGVTVFNRMSNSVKNDTRLDQQEITSFNAQLTPYIGEHISGSQVNTLIQLAISIDNSANQKGDTNKVVTIKSKDGSTTYVDANLVKANNNATKRVDSGVYYKVEGIYASNGLITTITIEK